MPTNLVYTFFFISECRCPLAPTSTNLTRQPLDPTTFHLVDKEGGQYELDRFSLNTELFFRLLLTTGSTIHKFGIYK